MQSGPEQPSQRLIRRNTVILAACLALSWAIVQLFMTIAAPLLADLTGRASLAGLAPAIFVAWWALATLGMGRFMDARGRAPGIRLGFLVCAAGCALVYVGTSREALAPFLLGMALIGGGAGAVNLARAGAADMYPKERRARGISFVLVGAAFGAILGPVAFLPLLARSGQDLDVLATPWIIAAALALLGVFLTYAIRTDPLEIGRALGLTGTGSPAARSIRQMLAVPVVRRALLSAALAQTVMTTMMSITGFVLHQHGHDWPTVAVTMSAHFLGMFGLVLVIGRLVDRIGRRNALALGFLVLIAGNAMMLLDIEVVFIAPAMFVIGVGWNLAFVAATAMMADATQPSERARLLGFADFVALTGAAIGAGLAGLVLDRMGIGALVVFGIGACLISLVAFVIPHRRAHAVPAAESCDPRVT